MTIILEASGVINGVGEEGAEGGVADDGREVLHISVHLVKVLGRLSKVNKGLGVVASILGNLGSGRSHGHSWV